MTCFIDRVEQQQWWRQLCGYTAGWHRSASFSVVRRGNAIYVLSTYVRVRRACFRPAIHIIAPRHCTRNKRGDPGLVICAVCSCFMYSMDGLSFATASSAKCKLRKHNHDTMLKYKSSLSNTADFRSTAILPEGCFGLCAINTRFRIIVISPPPTSVTFRPDGQTGWDMALYTC